MGHLPLFHQSFLQDRTFRVRVGTAHLNSFELGSVLSVTLFSVVINSIIERVQRDFRCTLYADDFSLSYASSCLDVVKRHIQLALGRVIR